jgi:BirA family transcriptional regulator, biotin operon repressor / biotin---[acetyl-CoA-carboxylase] ligase
VEENSLSPALVTAGLPTRFIGQKVIYFESLDSTMEAARRESIWGAPAGTVVIADEQTAGRGRLKRTWISPRGGLTLSVILRPNLEYLPYLIMIASLAVARSIENVTGLSPQIKWPNDVLISDKKVCGILIENDIRKNSLVSSVIGIGINVNVHIPDYPEISSLASSLSDQTGIIVSRLDILQQLLIEMERLYGSLPNSDSIFQQWKNRLVTLGQSVQVTQGDVIYCGFAESVSADGSLLLRSTEGDLIKIFAGDVSLSRSEV